MEKKSLFLIVILAAAALAGYAYYRLGAKNYDLVHTGMTGAEVVAAIGEPQIKTKQMDVDIWFYGVQNKVGHKGYGMIEYSLNADLAVIFNTDGTRVDNIDRAADKQWVISSSEPIRLKNDKDDNVISVQIGQSN